MTIRLRQVCVVVGDIDWAVPTLTACLDTYVAFRDPFIVNNFGGMHNALLQIGDCFLEVVTPTDGGYISDSTAAKRLRKHGDVGHMVIFQVEDIAQTSRRLAALGRAAVSFGSVVHGGVGMGGRVEDLHYKIGDSVPRKKGQIANGGVQWHPKDFGTLIETEEAFPGLPGASGSWLPAGNRWQGKYQARRSSVCEEFAAVEIAIEGDGQEAMAAKWSEGLSCPLLARDDSSSSSPPTLSVDGGAQEVRFVRSADFSGRTGVVAVDLFAAPGKPKAFREIQLCGIRWRLVDRPGADPSPNSSRL